jgi:hypothetical protein
LELHIKNKTTAEIDCKVSAGVEPMVRDSKSAEDTTINRKTIISYDNFIVSVKTYNNGTLGDSGSFDLSKGPSQKHQVTAYFDNNLRGLQAAFIGFPRQLSFFDETTMQYEFTMPLNGYDWTNHIVMGETDTGEKIY